MRWEGWMLPWRIRLRRASCVISMNWRSSASSEPVRDSLPNRDPGDALDQILDAVDVLDVDRGEHVEAGVGGACTVLRTTDVAREVINTVTRMGAPVVLVDSRARQASGTRIGRAP